MDRNSTSRSDGFEVRFHPGVECPCERQRLRAGLAGADGISIDAYDRRYAAAAAAAKSFLQIGDFIFVDGLELDRKDFRGNREHDLAGDTVEDVVIRRA